MHALIRRQVLGLHFKIGSRINIIFSCRVKFALIPAKNEKYYKTNRNVFVKYKINQLGNFSEQKIK